MTFNGNLISKSVNGVTIEGNLVTASGIGTPTGANSTGNLVEDNVIGSDVTGQTTSTTTGNSSNGVYILTNASSNQIGGLTDNNGYAISLGNFIVNNGDGVKVTSGTKDSILSNSITNNSGPGILLGTATEVVRT